MNVIVLCTGRCGSTTFAKACTHITNFSAAHESNWGRHGPARFVYPDNHIEVDNRLSWMLGEVEQHIGREAFYVHLRRNREETAQSFSRRWDNERSIIRAYSDCILAVSDSSMDICRAYVDCVNANIEAFLRDKPHQMTFDLECAESHFAAFWQRIGAKGDYQAGIREFSLNHNASVAPSNRAGHLPMSHTIRRAFRLVRR